jgi:hypothetical protein
VFQIIWLMLTLFSRTCPNGERLCNVRFVMIFFLAQVSSIKGFVACIGIMSAKRRASSAPSARGRARADTHADIVGDTALLTEEMYVNFNHWFCDCVNFNH